MESGERAGVPGVRVEAVRRALAVVFLVLCALGSCVLLEQGDGTLEPYKYEEVR